VSSPRIPPENPPHEYLTELEFHAWGGTLSFAVAAMRALDEGMKAEHGLSLTEFDVLITLYNMPGKRARMSDLSARVVITASGITQLVTRLERNGLVARTVDPADRRSFFAALTPAGDEKLRLARPTHNEIIRSRLTRRLTEAQLRQLGDLWKVVEGGG
jgi:MarR family transcriptional regulator, 2-MHQ and catechol-resistance regulon repressor